MQYDFKETDQLMQQASAQRVFPGAVLLVARHGEVLFRAPYGAANLFKPSPVTIDTVFDLASLTKPLVTTLSVMYLVQAGKMALDRPCAEYWPHISGTNKERIHIRHLLSHNSGLPAWRPYYLRLQHRPGDERLDLLKQWILTEPLCADPGTHTEYSDIGFLMLQWLVEQVTGSSLDRFYHDVIQLPLELNDLFFINLGKIKPEKHYAATELCPWRNRLLIGEVHDDNASVIGGVAGHAGLFGTADAVYKLLQGLLAADQGDGKHPIFFRSTLETFFTRRGQSTWALGFDTPSEKDSSAGEYFSAGSIGHLGYTGTSFWMDRNQGVIVLLLTNRVHPSRIDKRIRGFRPRLHNCVMKAIG